MNRQAILDKLAELPLTKSVDVLDDQTGVRRRFMFAVAGGGQCEIEIDADPIAEQLETLARNLPIPPGAKTAAITKLRALAAAAAAKRD